jgi:hypothetical protein
VTESTGEWFAGLRQEIAGRDQAERRQSLVQSYVHGAAQGEPGLGWIGRTWVRRGAGYWGRRVGVSVAYLLLALIAGSFTLGFPPDLMFSQKYSFNAHIPLAVKIVIVVLWLSTAIPAYLAMYRRIELYGFIPFGERPLFSSGFLGGRYLVLLAIPFFPALGGMVLAMFTVTLRHDFPGESAAREARRLRQELAEERVAGTKRRKTEDPAGSQKGKQRKRRKRKSRRAA